MIFVTVGTQLTFDRMIQAVDEWAATSDEEVVAQIGPSDLKPAHLKWQKFLSPDEFNAYMKQARVIVAHAGMGSILTALQLQKPIIILPRQAALKEHRNNHQIATAERFREMQGIHVAMNETEMLIVLQNLSALSASDGVGPYASGELITAIKDFIEGKSA